MAADVLDNRALNRATLARQLLLERVSLSVPEALEHLVGLQAQTPHTWYTGLWCRLANFRPEEASDLLHERSIVRLALMRGTIHLVTADDCVALRPLLAPAMDRITRGGFGKDLMGVDADAVARRARAFFEEKPRTARELRAQLTDWYPDRNAEALAIAVRAWLPLVQVTPRGVWGASGPSAHTTGEKWLGREMGPGLSADEAFMRYLGAFGPATFADAQVWSGLLGLEEVAERLRPKLDTFRDERGRELFDLPDAPRPDPETPAPVRFLYDYDNLLLSHADRSRFVEEAARKRVVKSIGNYSWGSVLHDGFGVGIWRVERDDKDAATLLIRPIARIARAAKDEIADEGERLLDFLAADAPKRRITFGPLM